MCAIWLNLAKYLNVQVRNLFMFLVFKNLAPCGVVDMKFLMPLELVKLLYVVKILKHYCNSHSYLAETSSLKGNGNKNFCRLI